MVSRDYLHASHRHIVYRGEQLANTLVGEIPRAWLAYGDSVMRLVLL